MTEFILHIFQPSYIFMLDFNPGGGNVYLPSIRAAYLCNSFLLSSIGQLSSLGSARQLEYPPGVCVYMCGGLSQTLHPTKGDWGSGAATGRDSAPKVVAGAPNPHKHTLISLEKIKHSKWTQGWSCKTFNLHVCKHSGDIYPFESYPCL